MDSNKYNLDFLNERFNYIDTITMIDNTGKVIVQLRYNPRFSKEDNERENMFALNKNILKVITSLNIDTSTLLRTLRTGKIVFCEEQNMYDHAGRKLVCTNINFPIVSRGKIIGAIELSKDITHIEKEYKVPKHFNIPVLKSLENSAIFTLNDIVTGNIKMRELKEKVRKVANSSSSVLIYGETGTGKELFVQAIHNEGYRKYKPFVAVNCAALPESLLEGILFGSVKGAFTGSENQKGLFEQAHGGTIYLDEINSMPINLQAKLLRTLQEKCVMRLGGATPIKVDLRVIASINKDPSYVLKNKEIREDLFYRLSVVNIKIPSLIERVSDLSIFVDHFIKKYNGILNKKVKRISDNVAELFMSYEWPGNVRELEHIIEGAMNVVEGDTIRLEHLPIYLSEKHKNNGKQVSPRVNFMTVNDIGFLKDAVEQVEKKMILAALTKTGGNVSKASKLLKVPRTTLQYKMEKYKLEFN